MAKMAFTTWLLQQANREDGVGDLAQSAERDPACPHKNSGLKVWKIHLRNRTWDDRVIETLMVAWEEYQAYRQNIQ